MRRYLHFVSTVAVAAAVSLFGSSALARTQAAPPTAKPAQAKPMPPAPPDVNTVPADAEKTASGLATKVIQPGTGRDHPKPTDMVTVNYTGWTTDGKAFDSTSARERPSTLSMERIMKGMSEGVMLMVAGEKRRMWVPEPLAYKGRPAVPKGMLVFDVELL